jgi:hypothetical protein
LEIFDHIGENRNEKLAIPFYGWIRNPVETMVRYLMRTSEYSSWCNKYDILKLMPLNDPMRLFSVTMQYTINSFFEVLVECGKAHNIPKEDVQVDFNKMMVLSDPKLSCTTSMDLIINKLLSESFIEMVCIYVPVVTDQVQQVIVDTFTYKTDIIFVTETDLRQIIESKNPKFTTVFVEDLDRFMDILQSYSAEEKKEYMSDTYYVLPAKSSLTEKAKKLSSSMGALPDTDIYKYKDFINAHLAEVNSYADFLQLKALRWR